MRIVLFIFCLFAGSECLFGLFGSSKPEPKEKITVTRPDNEPRKTENPDLGSEIDLDEGRRKVGAVGSHDDGTIHIPFNEPSTTISPENEKVTTPRPTAKTTTATTRQRITAATKILPSDDRHPSANCPNRADAYSSGPNFDYLFYEDTVYSIRDNRIISTDTVTHLFPSGPKKVDAAVYDKEREILVLIEGKSVYGYKSDGNVYKLESVYPKELPSSIAFTPDGALRWHDDHQMLLSNGGKFALYDEYWNKSLMTGRTLQYFKNLPDRVKGASAWRQGRANIFTQSLVFVYDSASSSLVGEGQPFSSFFHC